MRLSAAILLLLFSLLIVGCQKSATNQQSSTTQQTSTEQSASASPSLANTNATPTASASPNASQTATTKADIDPCSLLTSDEIRAVQGEPVKETKASQQSSGGLISLQCYYGLPTSANSVSLVLTETDPAKPGEMTAKQYWQQTFHGKEESEREGGKERDEKDKDKARAQKPSGEREEENEKGAPPEPVRGVGDEAFWTASRVGGALYVLKGQRFIRISIGGTGDAETKLKKSKTLAQNALRRL